MASNRVICTVMLLVVISMHGMAMSSAYVTEGEQVQKFAGGFKSTEGQAVDPLGNVWVTSIRGVVKIINPDPVAVNQHTVPQKTGFVLKSIVNTVADRIHVEFTLAGKDMVELGLYDCKGKLIKKLMNSQMAPGTCNINFNCGNIPSGIYFCRLKTGKGRTGISRISIFR